MNKTEMKLYDIIQYTVQANKKVLEELKQKLGELQFKAMLETTSKIEMVENIKQVKAYIDEQMSD